MNTSETITELEPNQVFVFGSNLDGYHVGGAAKLAYDKFGAQMGVGEGLVGQSYAFPTIGRFGRTFIEQDLKESVNGLYQCCRHNPDKTFLLTKVACGIAGHDESVIKQLFTESPSNLVKPLNW